MLYLESTVEEINRKTFLSKFENYAKKFEWNPKGASSDNYGSMTIIPMIQGTTEAAARSICNNGFAMRDLGFYGKAISTHYSSLTDKKTRFYLIAFVLPGNIFPVIEAPFPPGLPENERSAETNIGYYGPPVKLAFNLITAVENIPAGYPVQILDTKDFDGEKHAE